MTKAAQRFTIRLATEEDIPVLERLIAASVQVLQATDYTAEQREAALGTVFGVDSSLVRDGTYYVVEHAGEVVGCGGWSRRRTLFGSDRNPGREDALLDPAQDAARIRAFFVNPGWERVGIGSLLMKTCETAAAGEGFTRLELGSTLTGLGLYRAHGFVADEEIEVSLENGLRLPIVKMSKRL
ncbi:MAG TPA: GNAT family N-acetyltransferase [Terriglobales bacterium]|nr:GNAT family N-acetyltransferase [Terriglobales bacterium]